MGGSREQILIIFVLRKKYKEIYKVSFFFFLKKYGLIRFNDIIEIGRNSQPYIKELTYLTKYRLILSVRRQGITSVIF